ncbi:MAG: DUF5103 domain-containing protein [Candidatus Cyclobacteriaceae bacterium M3_2C_046]
MKNIYFFTIIFLLTTCVPINPTSTDQADETINKQLILADFVYEENIKSSKIYPFSLSQQNNLTPAVIPLAQNIPLVVEFDDLAEEADDYYARIIHCNAEWKKSILNDIEFVYEYNEFALTDYQYSFNTRIPYVHYRFEVPRVKIPGNFVVVVYRGDNENDIILSQRFVVFMNEVAINMEAGVSSGIVERATNQQLKFTINYADYDITNPYDELKVVLRQNQRWDNAIYDLKPTLIREDQAMLIYDHFTLENNFRGGNEFRFVDLRSVSFIGQNVGRIDVKDYAIDAYLLKDEPRENQAYAQYEDINGKFIIGNRDPGEDFLEAEYMDVHFFLEKQPINSGDIYITGELTNWNYLPENKMVYDPELEVYTGNLLLKQGWYNYIYEVKGTENPLIIEGSHFETENEYDLIVYHRPVGARADVVIGYRNLVYNMRLR